MVHTRYHFKVHASALGGALSRLGAALACPLLAQESAAREVENVHAEYRWGPQTRQTAHDTVGPEGCSVLMLLLHSSTWGSLLAHPPPAVSLAWHCQSWCAEQLQGTALCAALPLAAAVNVNRICAWCLQPQHQQ